MNPNYSCAKRTHPFYISHHSISFIYADGEVSLRTLGSLLPRLAQGYTFPPDQKESWHFRYLMEVPTIKVSLRLGISKGFILNMVVFQRGSDFFFCFSVWIGFPFIFHQFSFIFLSFPCFLLVFLHCPHFFLVFHWFSLFSHQFSFICLTFCLFSIGFHWFLIGFPSFSSFFVVLHWFSSVCHWLSNMFLTLCWICRNYHQFLLGFLCFLVFPLVFCNILFLKSSTLHAMCTFWEEQNPSCKLLATC